MEQAQDNVGERRKAMNTNGCNWLTVLKWMASLVIAATAWYHQEQISEKLDKLLSRPPVVITVERVAKEALRWSRTRRQLLCREYHYREKSSGRCRDARDK